MSKSPLILPSDPEFYELPPPPGSEPEPSLEDRLAVLSEDEEEPPAVETDEVPPPVPASCDGHVLIGRDTKITDYRALREAARLDRAVLWATDVVTPEVLAEATDVLDRERTRAAAIILPATTDAELRDFADAGVIAARMPMHFEDRPVAWAETDRIAARVHDLFGWDIVLGMDGRFLGEVEERLRAWPGRVVLEATGCFDGPVGDRDPGLRALLRLIDADKAWVTLSAPWESDPDAPRYPHATRIARQLIRFAPERMVWGSAWPGREGGIVPDLERLTEWCEDETLARHILTDNATALWRFPETEEVVPG